MSITWQLLSSMTECGLTLWERESAKKEDNCVEKMLISFKVNPQWGVFLVASVSLSPLHPSLLVDTAVY